MAACGKPLQTLEGTITIRLSQDGRYTTLPLTAVYSGSEDVTYQWNKDSSPISGATSRTYTPTAEGSYSVTVSDRDDPTNSKTSESVRIFVLPEYSVFFGEWKATGYTSSITGLPFDESVRISDDGIEGYFYMWTTDEYEGDGPFAGTNAYDDKEYVDFAIDEWIPADEIDDIQINTLAGFDMVYQLKGRLISQQWAGDPEIRWETVFLCLSANRMVLARSTANVTDGVSWSNRRYQKLVD